MWLNNQLRLPGRLAHLRPDHLVAKYIRAAGNSRSPRAYVCHASSGIGPNRFLLWSALVVSLGVNSGDCHRAQDSRRLREDGGMTSRKTAPPDVMFVNGASSAGKTSLIRAVQALVPVPYLHVGLDHFFASVPEPWGGGGPGRYSGAGFAYQACASSADALPRTAITVGPAGAAMYAAYRRSLVTLLEHGCKLAIDELLLSEEIGVDYLALLAPYDVQFVLMTAGADCLEQRCAMRHLRPGLGRWSLIAAGHLPHHYDLTFDSEQMMTQECAATVTASWGLADAARATADRRPSDP